MARSPAAVDLWRIDLDAAEPDTDSLSPDERERAARFVFERDRHRYVAGRAALRRILASRIGMAPGRLRFAYNTCGKPHLANAPGARAFNLSHSGALCVVALSEGGEIGIDIERIGPYDAGVAAEAFAPRECREIAALEGAGRDIAFAQCWTRKEAFIKAIGLGFSYPSREVLIDLGAHPRVLACRPEAGRAEDWRILPFDPGEGFVGAVALRGEAVLRWG